MARTQKNYKFTGKKHSGIGIAAIIMAICSVLLFIYAAAVSFVNRGAASPKIGCVGVLAVLLSGAAFFITLRELRRHDVFKRVPAIGALLSFFVLAGWIVVYVAGWKV